MEQWIGDVFGGLAGGLLSALVAIYILSRQQRQIAREILRQNRGNLMMAAATNRHLAEVWPTRGDLTPVQREQYLYADMILQNIFAYWESGEHSQAQVELALERVFQSPIVRDAWWAVAPERAKVVVRGTLEYAFYMLAHEAYVLAETNANLRKAKSLEYPPSPAPESTS